MKRIGILMLCSLLLTACFWSKDDDDDNSLFKGMTAKQLYTEAEQSSKSGEYNSASKRLEALESMYPFSAYTERAQLLLIYVYYQNDQYPSAAAEAEHYIHLYPRSKQVDYAYYMKGMANFQQPRTSLGRFLPMDESWRDPGTQLQAYSDLLTFIEKFPQSRYYANALARLVYLRNQFAQRELNNAEFYFERNMYVAAAGRASYLVRTYPQAPSAQRALEIMYRSYQAVGLQQAANDAAKVYQATYHHSIGR